MSAWQRRVVLAGRRLCIEGEDRAGLAAVAPALDHLEPDAAIGADEPPMRWTVAAAAADDRTDMPTGIYRLPGGGLAMIQRAPFSVERYDPEGGIRLAASPEGFAAGDLRAHPGALALAAWLGRPGLQMLHLGAVAFSGRGVLLVGPGGVGKSTGVLACARAGADFLGDDLCLVDCGDGAPPRVHALFGTVKLNADSADRLGAGAWPRLGVTPKQKIVCRVPPHIRIAVSATIAAIVILARAESAEGAGAVEALRPAAAVGAIAATGASPASGALDPGAWFATVTRLAKRVPAFRLAASWDLDRLAQDVHRLAGRDAAAAG